MYIQNLNIDPSTVNVEDVIKFTLSNEDTYCGQVVKNHIRSGYYVNMHLHDNCKIFEALGIEDTTTFVTDIVGYNPKGSWPETIL